MDRGAHFYQCDFQVHTPIDAAWAGPRPTTPQERARYAESFVAACRSIGLGAVAITDHHSMAYVPDIRAAALRETDAAGAELAPEARLVVFPGIELSLAVPCQALLIFDADLPDDRLSVVLEALAIGSDHEPKKGQIKDLEHIRTLVALYELLDQREWLRERYIVLPNVTDGGHKSLLRSHMQASYKEMPCVGGYLDGSLAKTGEGNRGILAGENAAWGNKRIAVFQTSDSRSHTFENLGRHTTWVKWAVPTAEALRQACLAQESRISQQNPLIPGVCITRLSVSNSQFMGPIELEFNPQYNAIIGGRGTGKSTILEYIRWALCDEQRPAGDELPDHVARQQMLVEQTLRPVSAHVDVHFSLNSIPHVVRRRAESGELLLRVADNEFRNVSVADVRALLPIHAFSQKQLSSVSVRLEELTRFVAAPIQSELDEIDTAMQGIASRLRENYASLQRHRSLTASVARGEMNVESIRQQALNVRSSLTDISEADRAVLAAKPQYDRTETLMTTFRRRLEQGQEAARAFHAQVQHLGGQELEAAADVDSASVRDAQQMARDTLAQLLQTSAAAAELADRATAPDSEFSKSMAAWEVERSAFERRYAEVKAASSTHETRLKELTDLEEREKAAAATLSAEREELTALGKPAERHAALRAEWIAAAQGRTSRLQERCAELTTLSGGLLRASLKGAAGLEQLSERIRSALSGSGFRGAKVDTFVTALGSEPEPLATWEAALGELERLTEQDSQGAGSFPTLLRLGWARADIDRAAARLTPESWLELALAPLADHPMFEYRTKAGEYIPFDRASAGQQATALLHVLLEQGGPPLIIDQPEEDLDSQVIQEIVTQLWKAKAGRQVIFTSHNANLVVNGDAELVVCCDYRAAGEESGGQIKLLGAIDVPAVRKEITVVMEGGEKAFRLRKDKYGF